MCGGISGPSFCAKYRMRSWISTILCLGREDFSSIRASATKIGVLTDSTMQKFRLDWDILLELSLVPVVSTTGVSWYRRVDVSGVLFPLYVCMHLLLCTVRPLGSALHFSYLCTVEIDRDGS